MLALEPDLEAVNGEDSHMEQNEGRGDFYDRMRGQVEGFLHTAPTTQVTSPPLGVGGTQTFIVETFRLPQGEGDFVFVQKVDAEGTVRFVIPPAISDVIARHRDTLSKRVRKAIGRQGGKAAQAKRKAEGTPAFGRKK